jgi:hypothetical protein
MGAGRLTGEVISSEAVLEGDASDVAGAPGDGGVDDDVRERLAKVMASTVRWIASLSDG